MTRLTMRWLALIGLLFAGVPLIASAQHETPGTVVQNIETIKAGSLIIAMDNDKQNIGSLFNVASYGLVVDLLNNNIPVKWAIRAGKTKDGTDFTVNASRIAPSALGASTLSFSGGPFIVEESYANLARARITAFGRNVAVYQTTADAQIDIRYDILFKPRPFVNTTNSAIITGLFDNAGISTYKVGADFSVEESSCYTIIMEPHNSVTTGTATIRSFLQSGGNFYAQCLSTLSFENAPSGFFMSSAGTLQADTSGTLSYPNPDLSFSQLIGAVNPAPGGSVEDWKLGPGSTWNSGTSSHAQSPASPSSPQSDNGTVHYGAMQNKFLAPSDTGGVVFYVGGHSYAGTALIDLNGQRLMFNAVLTPARRPGTCSIQPLGIKVPDLTLAKSHTGSYLIGPQDSYSFTVTNIGTAVTVDDYTVTDTLPAGLTFVSGAGTNWTFSSAVISGGRTVVTATNATSLAIGGTSTFTITVGITAAAIGSQTNTARVSGGGEVTLTNNTAFVSSQVVGLTGRVFEDLNTIGVEDPGDPGLSGLTVTVLDNSVTYTATTDASGNWTVAGLTPSTSATVTIGTSGANSILAGATQSVGTDPSTHAVGTSGTADGGKDGFRNIQTNIAVTKSGPVTALVGDTIQYLITTSNLGPNPATFVVVTDTLPAGVTLVSASRGATLSGSVLTWPAIPSVGTTVIDTVRVRVPSTVSTLVNIAAGTTQRFDTNATNNNGSGSGRVTTQLTIPDVSITKTHTGYFTMGAPGFYTITVTNGGTGPARNVVVIDTLPAGFGYDSTKAVSGNWSFVRVGQVVTASVTDSIAAGGSASFNVYVTPSVVVSTSPANTTVNNTATVTSLRETAVGNNSVTDPTEVRYADLTITKTAGTFVQGQPSVWTITVTNSGTGPTTGLITVRDSVGVGQTALTPAGSGWSFTTASPIVTGTYAASLAPGGSASFTLTVTPGPTSYPTPTNTAVVSGGSDAKTDNNSVTATASLAGASDLKITKTANAPTPFVYGTNATYSIKVDNIGAVATTGNIVVTDTLPAGMKFVSGANVIGTGWAFVPNIDGTVVVATYSGTALPGLTGTTTFSITALVLSTTASVKNIGRVSGGGDGTPGNNADSVTTAVTAKPDVMIIKRSPASFTQGTNATYTIVVRNVGVAATTANTVVVDSLPAGVAFVSRAAVVGSWGFAVSGNNITATSSTVLQPNDSVVFSVTVTPLAAGVPQVINKAVVSNTSENYLANDTAFVTTPVVGLADLNITKASSTFAEGTQGTYTIVIKNIGTWPTSGPITVLDTLPANIAYVSAASNPAGWTIGAIGQVVTATSSAVMQVTDSAVFTVTVNVGNVGTSVTNRAHVSGGSDSNAANNLATLVTTVGQKADLTMTKTSSTFAVGQTTATYTLTVTNIGSVNTTGSISVVDSLPAGVTFVSGAGSGWSVSAVGQVVTATAAALALGAGKTSAITVTVSIAAGAFPSVTNTAWVSGGGETNTTNNSGSLTTAVTAPDLTIAKTSLANFVIGSNTAAYSFVVTNSGTGTTSGATITVVDTLPLGVTAVAKNGSSNWTVAFDPATRIMTATSTTAVAAGGVAQTLAINVTFGAGTAPSVTNTAHVSVPNEVNTANNSSSVTTPVNGIDLALTKTSSALFTPGTTGTYTLSVKNVGNVTTSGTMTVVDTLPANLTLTTVTTPQDNWTVSVTTVGGRAIVTATRTTTLAVNATTSITVNPTVTAAAMPSVYNRGWVSGGGQLNSPLNDSSSVVTPVATPDLTVTKLATTPTFDVAGTGVYRITVKNIGNYLAAGPITVRDTLPTGLTYSTASGTGWTFANVGQVVVATYAGNIAVADSAFFTLSVAVGQAASPNVTNTARVAAGTEQNVANNSSTVTTLVGGQPDLLIIKTANTANFTYGASGTYTIKVTNVGTLPTSASITVVDSLAAGLAYTSGSGTGWTVNQASGVVTATNAGPIQPGDTARFTITVTVGVGATSVGNTARVSGGGDSNTANNTSTITTPIIAPDLTVAKIATNTFQTGSNGTYQITVNNIGTAPTTANFTVVDTLRAGLTYVSGSGTNWSFAAVGQIVTATYSGSAVAADGSTSFILTVAVGAAAVPSVQNSAVVAGGGEWKTDNDTVGPITTNVGGQSDLTLAKSATGTFLRGSDATYTFVVSNIGTIATTGSIVVTDTLASELTFKSGLGTSWAFNAVGQVVTATYTGTDLPATTGTTSFTLTVGISVLAGSSVSNTAWVSGGGELNTTNDKSGPIVTPLGGAPNITVVKSVTPSTNIIPGSVLNYSITFLNGGNAPAVNVVVTDDLPIQVQYKVGSISESYPGTITAVTEFYNGTAWTYTPVSGGCSAPVGFDGCVTKIRWSLQSAMPQTTQGVIGLQARVK